MKFYTATRTLFKSPVRKYFKSIDELNAYYGINTTIEDYNCGYSFIYKGKPYLLGYEEDC